MLPSTENESCVKCGHKLSDETKAKISSAKKGHKLSDEHKANISAGHIGLASPKGFTGHKHSDETKRKLSLLKVGNTYSKGHKNSLGRKQSEETKKKLSERNYRRKKLLGYINSPETRIKLSASWNDKRIDNLLKIGHNKNYVQGIYNSSKVGNIKYRSSLELRMYKILDASNNVIDYEIESLKVPYLYNGKRHVYVPDIYVIYCDRSSNVIEIKPKSHVDHDELCKAKFQAAEELFGNDFIVVTEYDLRELENEYPF